MSVEGTRELIMPYVHVYASEGTCTNMSLTVH